MSQDDLAIAFSPDSRSLITASRRGGLDFWDVDTGKKIKTYFNLKKKGDTYSGVLFTPDGKHLAATYKDEKIVVLEATGGRAVSSFSGHQGPITSFAISRDAKLLVSGGSDKRIIVRDLATGEKIKDIAPLPDRVNDLDISPDGLLIAAAIGPFTFPWEALKPETGVMIIDLKTGQGRLQRIPFCYQVAFSPDGQLLATGISSGEEVAIIWDISSYRIADQLKKNPFETTAEYEARVGQTEIPYAEEILLKADQYDADRSGFVIQFKNNKLFILVEREIARELTERKAGVLRLSGQLKYHDTESLKLEGAVVEDTVTGKKFPVVKTGEVSQESK